MATTIHLEGYLYEIKELSWGTALRVGVNNRVKNDATGEWETASTDYYDVVLGDGVRLGAGVAENAPVVVDGTFKVGKTYSKRDGSTGVELKVRATSVEALERGSRAAEEDKPF